MKNTLTAIAAALSLAISGAVFAGSANLSTSQFGGTSYSYSYNTGVETGAEIAVGYRHLDASAGGNTSVRNENYVRTSVSSGAYTESVYSNSVISGSSVDATRVGESHINVVTEVDVYGVAVNSSASAEAGTFYAYDDVGDTYSYEYGAYSQAQADSGYSYYGSELDVVTHTDSAYGIYGAN